MKKNYLYLLIITFLTASVFSLLASSSPDGLEKVAEDKGFIANALDYPVKVLMPDYSSVVIKNEYLATAIAGILGSVLVFLFVYILAKIIIFSSLKNNDSK